MPKLVIKIKFSRGYAAFLYGMHGLVCLIIVVLAAPVWAKMLLILWVIASGYFVPTKAHPVLELAHDEGERWHLQTKTRRYPGVLSGMSWISPYAAILVFSVADEKRVGSVVLFPDSVDKTALRRLMFYLKIT